MQSLIACWGIAPTLLKGIMGRLVLATLSCTIISTAIAFAGPAIATDGNTQNAAGTYSVQFGTDPTPRLIWVITPCDNDANQCIQVNQFSPNDTARKHPVVISNAHWTVGSWIMDPVNGAAACKDGTKYDVFYDYSWDADTNSGWRSFNEPGICDGKKAGGKSTQFTLTKIGSPPPAQPQQ